MTQDIVMCWQHLFLGKPCNPWCENHFKCITRKIGCWSNDSQRVADYLSLRSTVKKEEKG